MNHSHGLPSIASLLAILAAPQLLGLPPGVTLEPEPESPPAIALVLGDIDKSDLSELLYGPNKQFTMIDQSCGLVIAEGTFIAIGPDQDCTCGKCYIMLYSDFQHRQKHVGFKIL